MDELKTLLLSLQLNNQSMSVLIINTRSTPISRVIPLAQSKDDIAL